jgi:hypothetical protein
VPAAVRKLHGNGLLDSRAGKKVWLREAVTSPSPFPLAPPRRPDKGEPPTRACRGFFAASAGVQSRSRPFVDRARKGHFDTRSPALSLR